MAVTMVGGTPALAQEGSGAPGGITGYVTDLSGTAVLIEENPSDRSGSAQALVGITAETEVFRQQDQQRVPAGPEDLEVGQRVEATFVGPVAESYPVQTTAGSITILPDPDEPGGAGGSPGGANVLPDTGGASPGWEGALLAGGCILAGVLLLRPRPGDGNPKAPRPDAGLTAGTLEGRIEA